MFDNVLKWLKILSCSEKHLSYYYSFLTKEYNSGTTRWRRCKGQGMKEGMQSFHALCACLSPSTLRCSSTQKLSQLLHLGFYSGFPGGSDGREAACSEEDPGSILRLGGSLGNLATHSRILAIHSSVLTWRIPWKEKPGRLQFMGSQRVIHDWVTNIHTYSGVLGCASAFEMQEMQERQVWSLGQKNSLEKEMATHSSILVWEDKGFWWAAVHGAAESGTTERLSTPITHTHTHTHTHRGFSYVSCIDIGKQVLCH